MNLPNKITLFRIVLIPVYMLFAFPWPAGMSPFGLPDPAIRIVLLVLFVAAELSDMADGKIARKRNLITDFGKFLDPIADKLLVSVAMLGLAVERPVFVWALMITLLREFTVTGFRLVASAKGMVIAAGKLGKIKTFLQTVSLTVLLAAPVFAYILEIFGKILTVIGDVGMIGAVIMTVVSGVEYVVKNKTVLQGSM